MSNNSNITEWIKYDLYPQLFERIDLAFPELDFNRDSKGWRSGLKMDLSEPKQKRPDKTVISKKSIGHILEQGGETLSLIDYTIKRDGSDFSTALKTLSNIAGITPPTDANFDREAYKKQKESSTILEDCNSYFIYCLEHSKEATEVTNYLIERGYSLEDIKEMELGFIISQDKLYKYLTETKKHSKESVEEAIKLNKGIGSTHRLTIPYRSGDTIKGFKFRTTGDSTPKYYNSTGLDRLGGFFNLSAIKGDKDIVIVEGELDSLHASIKGLNNVVSTGGNSIASEQIKDAIKRGAKSFTICLDRETNKEEETAKKTLSAIDTLLKEGVKRIYIAELPDIGGEKTDPDKLIKEQGAEALKESIKEALPYYEYKLQETLNRYGKIEEQRGALDSKDIDNLLEEIVETATKIKSPTDRDRYKKAFTSLPAINEIGITEESLSITVDRLTSTKEKEAKNKSFDKLLFEVKQLQSKGETDKALDLLENKAKEVKLKDKKTEFSKFLIPTSEETIKQEEKNLPDSLSSGYSIGGEDLVLNGGAITVFAAPTNHGKTALLINTLLNVAESNPDKKFVFFTYEERANSIIQYLLNTYLDISLNSSDKANRRLLREYFKTGDTGYIKGSNLDYFNSKKEEFFKKYIETGRIIIKYSDLDSKELTTAIEFLNKEEPTIGAVFIDYFQLLRLPKPKNSRQEELKQICIDLKDTAVTTGLPLILAAQFNREVTNLMRLHPTNIGEAGDIERIVNTLVGLWNMNKKAVLKGIVDSEAQEINNKLSSRNLSELDTQNMYLEILKSRDVATGSYEFLEFNGNTGKIKNRGTDNSNIFE